MLAVPIDVPSSVADRGITVLRIDTSAVHVGYARLLREDKTLLKAAELFAKVLKAPVAERHGPAACTTRPDPSGCDGSPETKGQPYSTPPQLQSIDLVPCVRCPIWPYAAAEWIVRKRRHGWPSPALIDEIVGDGCLFVGVSHKLSDDREAEFATAFSKAENRLVDSWTRSQEYCYLVLHEVKDRMNRKGGEKDVKLSTYYFKTLMLWSVEEEPNEFWHNGRLSTSVKQLLHRMTEWIVKKRCPNYFIPANNMMDYLPENVKFQQEIEYLSRVMEQIDTLFDMTKPWEKANFMLVNMPGF